MANQEGTLVSVAMKTKITDGEHQQVLDLSTDGQLFYKDAGLFLQFKEKNEELGTVNQIVKMEVEKVTVIRQGAVSMKQLFLQGEMTEGVYRSSFGTMLMNTTTNKICTNFDEETGIGSVQLIYQLHMQSEFAGDYEVTIDFRRK